MSSTLRLIPLALLLVVGWISLSAMAPQEESAASPSLVQDGEDSPLEKPMKGLKDGVRSLRRQLTKTEYAADAIDTIQTMQSAALEAFNHFPPPIREMDEKETQLWNIKFRRGMLKVADILCQLEAAVVEGDQTAIQTHYRQLGATKKSGHKEFQPEEE